MVQQWIFGVHRAGQRLVQRTGDSKEFRATRRRDEEQVAGREGGGDGDVGIKYGKIGRLVDW